MADALKNLATGLVSARPSPQASGTSMTIAGYGAEMPAVPFYAFCGPDNAIWNRANAELIRVTGRSGDSLNPITRNADGLGALAIDNGWRIRAGLTKEFFDNIPKLDVGNTFTAAIQTVVTLAMSGILDIGANGFPALNAKQVAANAVLLNKLLGTDTKAAYEVRGDGKELRGPGGTTDPDSVWKREAAGIMAHMDFAETAYKIIRGASPSGANDLVTRGFFDAAVPPNSHFTNAYQLLSALADTAAIQNQWYCVPVVNPAKQIITGVELKNGTVVNGNLRSALYDSAFNKVADRVTGTAQSGTSTRQRVAFDTASSKAPGDYYACIWFSGATAKYFGATGIQGDGATGNAAGGPPASITIPGAPGLYATAMPLLRLY